MPESVRRLSVSAELHGLGLAMDALHRLLIDGGGLLLEPKTGDLFACAASSVALVRERLRLLTRAVVDDIDPQLLWNGENSARARSPDDDPDLLLVEWSHERWAARARQELRRIEHAAAKRTRRKADRKGRGT
jgi:hypothetical protein